MRNIFIVKTAISLVFLTIVIMNSNAQNFKFDKSLTSVSSAVMINESKEKVWQTLYVNYGDVALFHPGIESSSCIGSYQKGGKDVQRQCNINDKKFIKETIMGVEEGKSFTVELDEAHGVPFDKAYAEYELVVISNDVTQVIQSVFYRTKPAFVGKMMKGKMGESLGGVMIGLKYHMETGGSVDKKEYKKISQVYKNMNSSDSFKTQI